MIKDRKPLSSQALEKGWFLAVGGLLADLVRVICKRPFLEETGRTEVSG